MQALLDQELATYEAHRQRLLADHEGKFVLIHGSELIGVFDSEKDAIDQGFERLGNVPFLVKQILRVELPQSFVTNLLGI